MNGRDGMRSSSLAILGFVFAVPFVGCERTVGHGGIAEPSVSSSGTWPPAQQPVAHQTATVAKRMEEHSVRAFAIKDAIAKGDLDRAKLDARWLAESEWTPNLRKDWHPEMQMMRAGARSITEAPDLGRAAYGLARVANGCASCHVRVAVPPKVPEDAPPDDGAPRGQIHAWAMNRMWQGLTVPSDEAWLAGARLLTLVPLDPDMSTVTAEVSAEPALLALRAHELGTLARVVDVDRRGAIFAEVLVTCAHCHDLLGVKLP
jgi:hypothetical protein